jgi:hypothetical protein
MKRYIIQAEAAAIFCGMFVRCREQADMSPAAFVQKERRMEITERNMLQITERHITTIFIA